VQSIRIEDVGAVPEFSVTSQVFPLSEQVFKNLSLLIKGSPPPSVNQDVKEREVKESLAISIASQSETESTQTFSEWLNGEFQWRALNVLETLLQQADIGLRRAVSSSSTALEPRVFAPPSTPAASSGADIGVPPIGSSFYSAIGDLLLESSANCGVGVSLSATQAKADRLRERLWDLRNQVVAFVAPAAFPRVMLQGRVGVVFGREMESK